MVVETGGDDDPFGGTEGDAVERRAEGDVLAESPRFKSPDEEKAPHGGRPRIAPNGVLDVDDGLDQGNEAEVGFEEAEDRAIPSAPTGAHEGKFFASSRSQLAHELAEFDHALADRFDVPDEVGIDGEKAIEMSLGRTGVMKGKMREGDIPATVIIPPGQSAIADVAAAHERVEEKNGWRRRTF